MPKNMNERLPIECLEIVGRHANGILLRASYAFETPQDKSKNIFSHWRPSSSCTSVTYTVTLCSTYKPGHKHSSSGRRCFFIICTGWYEPSLITRLPVGSLWPETIMRLFLEHSWNKTPDGRYDEPGSGKNILIRYMRQFRKGTS